VSISECERKWAIILAGAGRKSGFRHAIQESNHNNATDHRVHTPSRLHASAGQRDQATPFLRGARTEMCDFLGL
jgi:hypothetical protein